MKRNTFLFNIIILFSLIFLSTGQLYSQETAPEESSDSSLEGAESEDPAEETKKYPLPLEEGEEAPEHVFDMDLGGVGADVFWEGYWRFSMTYGTGFEI